MEEKSFETKLTELEAVIGKLESGGTALAELMELYERGNALYRECSEILKTYEKKLQTATEDGSDAGL